MAEGTVGAALDVISEVIVPQLSPVPPARTPPFILVSCALAEKIAIYFTTLNFETVFKVLYPVVKHTETVF